ncbi:phage tail protein [Photobacterium damselae]|uniref:phage tail protein n=1 Tax=Photobacterium damselae TaxID=38293 RepID=UPI002F3E6A5E
MLKLELPFWMNKGELNKLKKASQSFWEQVQSWVSISLTKFDLMTCDLVFVDLIAWERKITRLDGEIESVYRKRVLYAFINAQDAGMTKGMFNIFERLGIPVFDIRERQPGKDWDIVTIELSDDILSDHKPLVNLLIKTYGATCRRYEYSASQIVKQYTHVGTMSCRHNVNIAVPSFIAYGYNHAVPYIVVTETPEIIVHE